MKTGPLRSLPPAGPARPELTSAGPSPEPETRSRIALRTFCYSGGGVVDLCVISSGLSKRSPAITGCERNKDTRRTEPLPHCVGKHQAVEIASDHIIVKLSEIPETIHLHSNHRKAEWRRTAKAIVECKTNLGHLACVLLVTNAAQADVIETHTRPPTLAVVKRVRSARKTRAIGNGDGQAMKVSSNRLGCLLLSAALC